jgi:hypothetical protein
MRVSGIKSLLVSFAVCLSIFSYGQKTLLEILNESPFGAELDIVGIGVVEAEGRDLFVYDDKGSKIVVINVTEDDVIITYKGKQFNRYSTSMPIHPRQLGNNPDYFRLAFDCLRKTNDFYQVVLDEKMKLFGYIKQSDSSFKFLTAFDYVKNWSSLGFDFDCKSNPMRVEPTEQSGLVKTRHNRFKILRAKPLEYRGDWVKVKVMNEEESINEEVAWIRWKAGNKILIKLYFSC